MHTEPNQSLDALLGQLGPSEGGLQIVRLDGLPQPEHLRYADLIKPPPSDTPRPGAVVEMEAQPVLYAIAATEVTELPRLQRLHWTLTCRHDADYLAVLEPGRLTLHRLGLFDALPSPRVLDIAQIGDLMSLRSTLALIHKPTDTEPSQDLSDALFALFHRTVDALVGIGLDDALSLTGRALFLRFLLDRGIIVEADRQKICPSSARLTDAFANPVVAAETCSWLNQTFNGDLLPLPAENLLNWFRSLERDASNARVFSELSNIMHKAPNGQLRFDCSWAALDFGHIPVGLLSQVYEQHSHRHSPWARSESVYYTPRRIAEYMLDEVFANLEQPSAARVLDPAVGAGVFLVVAFRRLAEARWRCDDSRPGTRELREILYQQLTGFDISEAALRLTALSLYLTALELDPDPKPHSALKFSHLRGRVLFDVCEAGTRGPGRAGLPPLGSLGRQVGPEHDGKYDVIVHGSA